MKSLSLFILILVNTFCKAQNFNKVISTTSYFLRNGEWVKKQTKYPENMFVITENYTIRITNKTKSSFVTYGNPEKKITDKEETYTWPGYDKEGNECLFCIVKTKGCDRMQYTFFLENEAEEYLVDPY